MLERISLSVAPRVLNPVRKHKGTAKLTLTGFYTDGSHHTLRASAAAITAKNKKASGHAEVVAIQGNKVVAQEGGIATIEAAIIRGGKTFKAATEVVVAPFYRDYHQTLVMKLFLGMEGDPVESLAKEPMFQKPHDVMCTFEEALEIIRKTDNLTRGILKIIYLVGWQKGGHDHGYPAWSEVNPRLKRKRDATALDSLRWLIRKARKFNTTVSLHINMVDAYKQSPLWDEYVAKDCFAREEDGQLRVSGIQMKGEDMYNVVYPREWEAGLAQRRIDGLIEMIPELKGGHTIHVDVFVAQREGGKPISPWHARPENGGLTPDKYVETQGKIFHYWREHGFDVTGEGIFWAHPPGEGFTGWQAMSWWYHCDAEYQMEIPEYLMARGRTSRGDDGDFRFGSSMHGEEIWQKDKENMPGFLSMFCRTTLPWYYLSRLERVRFENDVLYYSDGVAARREEGKRVIRRGDFILREEDNLFVPALWQEKEIIAYSRNGYENKSWLLPDDWKDVKSVDLYKITLEGCVPLKKDVSVTGGKLSLSIGKDEAVSVVPAGTKLLGESQDDVKFIAFFCVCRRCSGPCMSVSAAEVLDPAKPDRGNDEWRMRHDERVADVRNNADKLEVLFIGDSITGGWRDIGKAVWEKEFVPLHAANIGIAGSQTSHILWQFENGAIDGIHPRVAVLMIGVNNVMAAPYQSAADIAGGVSTIVSRLREKLPRTKILLLGTFPKDKAPNAPDRRKIQEINALIAKLDDGKWIRFLDIGGRLLDKDGNLTAEVSSDGVHLTEKGYRIWAEAIQPVVREMMTANGEFLTPDALAMPRRQIALKGIDLRLINARGAVSFREYTVSGIDSLWIAPRAVSRVPAAFNLSFREETLGALIEDNQDEWRDNPLCVWQNWNRALDNRALGIWKNWGNALMLPFQGATWAPDAYTRRGTFHHYLGKDLISFGVVSCTVPAADVDGAYEELTITNRTDRPLSLTLIPDQPLGDRVEVPSGGNSMPPPVEPAWENKRSARFSRREGGFLLQALSDIGPSQGDGWRLDLPARGQRIVHVALLVADAGAAEPAGHYAADLAARFAASRQTTVDLLRRAAAQLPRIETGNPRLDAFYQRSILSLLQCRRDRADSPIRPFYDIGFGDGNSVTWDVSFSASLLAMFAPDEAKRMLTAFLSAGGVMNSTWLSAKDGRAGSFYMQSPFALLEIAQRYMRQTGNRALLEEKAGSKTVFEHFRDGGQTLLDSYLKDGLIDAGEGTGKMLEIRTSGYEHTIAAINGMAVDYLQQVADWCRQRGDAKADTFQAAARRLHDEIERRLWDEGSGWYINLYPDGSRHRVMSYHVFDLLRQPSMPEAHRRRLARHIVPGEFLGPYGMYSIALSDKEHWDMEDCDWGGGGQYVGQPLSIAESLYRMEEPERAWDVLSRCLLWVDRFPYFPQTIYTDELVLDDHSRGWSLQVSAGAGAQAIIHGVFGLMPQDDGNLVVRPHYNKSLGTATLKGYRFRDHRYDLRMDTKTFQVCRDGVPLTEERHGTYITITEQGSVSRGP